MKPRETWTRQQFLRYAPAVTFGTAGGLGLYAWRIEPHRVEVVRRPLPLPLLPPSLEGATLVQLGDLHVGPRVDEWYIASTRGPGKRSTTRHRDAYGRLHLLRRGRYAHGGARARPRAPTARPLGDACDAGQPRLRYRLVSARGGRPRRGASGGARRYRAAEPAARRRRPAVRRPR